MRWDAAVQIQYIIEIQKEVQDRSFLLYLFFKGWLGYGVCSFTNILSLSVTLIPTIIYFQPYTFSQQTFFGIFFGGLECVGHSFAYVAHLVFHRDVWIWTQSPASKQARYQLSHPSPY